ncbi:MAG: type I DNA topoisomerase [Acidimicrobiaceae bacterium]|nr:type I DNA topoisomerase [Acidimicrobiaceae bacterium]MCY4280555.1 type I DNA topoisomerase [Acidimicrobiaceae bacterium]MCY4294782.1 type I DNA topoisomerase [Acidimicrobiaceae bacterium]
MPMANSLVIVESPAKAKTISGYLGAGYVVESSIGHIRDLPRSAAEVPKSLKDEPWARLGIDVDNDFKPHYVVSTDKRKQVSKLKGLLADADELYLATDEDREGEAIAWHLLEVLNPRVPVKRMVFHEITKPAITAALHAPRDLDRRLVDAQETRRMLDRLYGYEVSPVLWKKIMPQLSAGRVQSVAVRIVVERERQRMDFVSANYWGIVGRFAPADAAADSDGNAAGGADGSPAVGAGSDCEFNASLVRVDGSRVAVSRDFGPDGRLTRDGTMLLTEPAARSLARDLQDADFSVLARTSKPYRRRPAAPFITSTLQQEAARKLNMASAAAMRTAQSLYEKGHITYMRTDSTSLSSDAVAAARSEIAARFDSGCLPPKPRVYASRVKNAQEAHEAIRPSGDKFADPATLAGKLSSTEARLYELIWQRTLASQMTDCTGETVQLRLGATSSAGSEAEFAASGTVISHLGFREVYTEGRDAGDAAEDSDSAEARLPPLQAGDAADCRDLTPGGSDTKPPARYTEASLVRRLEELGVGRPSTYSSIMGTIIDRGYVWKKGSALVPSFTAFSVVNLLERHFPKLVDYAFTAEMEDQLDRIAAGDAEQIPWLRKFYFGDDDGDPGLKAKVTDRLPDIDARLVNSIPLGADADGVAVEARVGRYGPLVQRGEDIASVPEDTAVDELTVERALELLAAGGREGRELGKDPVTGLTVTVRTGRYGPYVQLGSADETPGKPKNASLFASMSVDAVTLEQALTLLSLPRSVGCDADGAEVTVQNGRYGPFVRRGAETRSLSSEEQLFTVTLEECLELLAQPKSRGRAAAAAPLRELGTDPATDRAVVVKDGRYGHYVTDGETNASLRSGDTVEGITIERAAELLAERRAKGPAKKRPSRRGTSRKSR